MTKCYILDISDMETSLLTNAEIMPYYAAKARRFHSRDRALSALGVGVLLSQTLGITTDHALTVDAYGKPFLTAGDHKIGISHAGALVVLAVSYTEVGIDVEPIPDSIDRRHHLTLKKAYGDGINRIEYSFNDLTPCCFSKLWTRIEAAVKLDGRGLRLNPGENPQLFEGMYFHTREYKRHIITVATYEASAIKIIPVVL